MKTDIEIARKKKLIPISEIAKKIGISEKDLEYYGKGKAKIQNTKGKKQKGKLRKSY